MLIDKIVENFMNNLSLLKHILIVLTTIVKSAVWLTNYVLTCAKIYYLPKNTREKYQMTSSFVIKDNRISIR